MRSYVIDVKGKEHIVQFAPETWWLADATSLASGRPSEYFYEAIEDSEVLLIDRVTRSAVDGSISLISSGRRPRSAWFTFK